MDISLFKARSNLESIFLLSVQHLELDTMVCFTLPVFLDQKKNTYILANRSLSLWSHEILIYQCFLLHPGNGRNSALLYQGKK